MKLYLPSLLVSIILSFLGAIFKMKHYPGAGFMLQGALLVSFVYIVLGIINVWGRTDKGIINKVLWTVGFLLFSWVSGLIYYIKELKQK